MKCYHEDSDDDGLDLYESDDERLYGWEAFLQGLEEGRRWARMGKETREVAARRLMELEDRLAKDCDPKAVAAWFEAAKEVINEDVEEMEYGEDLWGMDAESSSIDDIEPDYDMFGYLTIGASYRQMKKLCPEEVERILAESVRRKRRVGG
jgi:hypothetical protein